MASPPGLKKNMPESLQQHTNATPPVKSPKKPLTQVNNEIVSENLDNVKIDQNNVPVYIIMHKIFPNFFYKLRLLQTKRLLQMTSRKLR